MIFDLDWQRYGNLTLEEHEQFALEEIKRLMEIPDLTEAEEFEIQTNVLLLRLIAKERKSS